MCTFICHIRINDIIHTTPVTTGSFAGTDGCACVREIDANKYRLGRLYSQFFSTTGGGGGFCDRERPINPRPTPGTPQHTQLQIHGRPLVCASCGRHYKYDRSTRYRRKNTFDLSLSPFLRVARFAYAGQNDCRAPDTHNKVLRPGNLDAIRRTAGVQHMRYLACTYIITNRLGRGKKRNWCLIVRHPQCLQGVLYNNIVYSRMLFGFTGRNGRYTEPDSSES